jgi:hypothetical protein
MAFAGGDSHVDIADHGRQPCLLIGVEVSLRVHPADGSAHDLLRRVRVATRVAMNCEVRVRERARQKGAMQVDDMESQIVEPDGERL